jgi:hypothetical protein
MQALTTSPGDDLTRPLPTNLWRVSPGRLGAMARAQEGQDRLIVPKADEEAWEGTEIDVRRTVL